MPDLSPNDQRLLDALIESGFDPEAMQPLSEAERRRVDRLMQLFGLMHDYPVEDGDETLIHATMAQIDRHESQLSAQMKFDQQKEAQSGRGFGIPMPNFIGVAAAVLLAASVLWPMLNMVRQHALDTDCANNMRYMGYAFSNYAADNNYAMPTVAASMGSSWDTFANRINLQPLLEGQYCSHGHLNCPGNHDGLHYSYQWQKAGTRLSWGTQRITIVLGDRNPIMDAARQGRPMHHMAMSPDHRGRGQNVLATDGATMWLSEKPVVDRMDNIWLPHGMRELRPGAQPQDKSDVFLAH